MSTPTDQDVTAAARVVEDLAGPLARLAGLIALRDAMRRSGAVKVVAVGTTSLDLVSLRVAGPDGRFRRVPVDASWALDVPELVSSHWDDGEGGVDVVGPQATAQDVAAAITREREALAPFAQAVTALSQASQD